LIFSGAFTKYMLGLCHGSMEFCLFEIRVSCVQTVDFFQNLHHPVGQAASGKRQGKCLQRTPFRGL